MAAALAQPVVLDATVLSNYASSGSVGWLIELLSQPVVVPAVRDELEAGQAHGHAFLAAAIELLGDDLSLLDVTDDPQEGLPERSVLRAELDPGEADSLRCAIAHDGTLATDDLAARRLAGKHDVPVTGSVGLLVVGIERGVIDVTTANEWLDTWRAERGYYAPVERVEDALDDTDP